jgi:phosphoribosylaminoimidazole carboxylase PurE protein
MAFVPIIMGSDADLSHGRQIAAALAALGIDSEVRVASAHKAPRFVLDLLAAYEGDGRPKVYVTVAGRSNALSGLVDASVAAPVIACPPYSDRFGGADVFSSLRMPSGVAPATVLEPAAAALLAAKILALAEPALRTRVESLQAAQRDGIAAADTRVRAAAPGQSQTPESREPREARAAVLRTDGAGGVDGGREAAGFSRAAQSAASGEPAAASAHQKSRPRAQAFALAVPSTELGPAGSGPRSDPSTAAPRGGRKEA